MSDDNPVCPFCGYKDHDWWDGLNEDIEDGGSWIIPCKDCGKDYEVTIHMEYSFDVKRVD